MKRPLSIGAPHPTRPGYFLVGFAACVRHHQNRRYMTPQKAQAFPLWRKLDKPPHEQLSLLDLL